MDVFETDCSREIAAALIRQEMLAGLLGEHQFAVDLHAGTFTVDDGTDYQVGLLGSESYQTDTWKWAWDNAHMSDLPAPVLADARNLREYGTSRGVTPLSEGTYALPEDAVFPMALVWGGLAGGYPVYRAPYETGAAYLLIKDAPLPPLSSVAPITLPRMLGTAIGMNVPVDHRLTAQGLFAAVGWSIEDHGDRIVALSQDAEPDRLVVSFDARGRMSAIDGTLRPRD